MPTEQRGVLEFVAVLSGLALQAPPKAGKGQSACNMPEFHPALNSLQAVTSLPTEEELTYEACCCRLMHPQYPVHVPVKSL